MRAVVPVVAVASLLASAMADAADQALPFFAIPTDAVAAVDVPDGEPLRVRLHSRDAVRLAGVLGAAVPPSGAGQLEYVVDRYPQLAAERQRTWLESTFVVDYREPEVTALRAELVSTVGERPTPEQVVSIVAKTLKPSHLRGWDVASIAARNREGDCSEHAVLTAALARSVGIPARVVLGAALLTEHGRAASYGHAWAEVSVEGRWMIADSALIDAPVKIRHIPFGILEDEDPGFVMSLIRLNWVWIQRIEVLGSASGHK